MLLFDMDKLKACPTQSFFAGFFESFAVPVSFPALESADSFASDFSALASPLGPLLRPYSLTYHPPPLNWIAGAEGNRSTLPPQCGHFFRCGPRWFSIRSVRRRHFKHSYSYIGT